MAVVHLQRPALRLYADDVLYPLPDCGLPLVRRAPRFRRLIENAPTLIVHCHIERQERSVNVIAERFEPLSIVSDAEPGVHSFH